MPLILDLPSDLENALTAEAARLRLPLPEYAVRLLATIRLPDPKPRTGEELLAYWQNEGLIGTRSYIADAPQRARALRHEAERRKRS